MVFVFIPMVPAIYVTMCMCVHTVLKPMSVLIIYQLLGQHKFSRLIFDGAETEQSGPSSVCHSSLPSKNFSGYRANEKYG